MYVLFDLEFQQHFERVASKLDKMWKYFENSALLLELIIWTQHLREVLFVCKAMINSLVRWVNFFA